MSTHPPVSIDRELCAGHGRCYSLLPDVFYPDDMGNGHVMETVDVAPATVDLARVVSACPEEAISLVPTTEEV